VPSDCRVVKGHKKSVSVGELCLGYAVQSVSDARHWTWCNAAEAKRSKFRNVELHLAQIEWRSDSCNIDNKVHVLCK